MRGREGVRGEGGEGGGGEVKVGVVKELFLIGKRTGALPLLYLFSHT